MGKNILLFLEGKARKTHTEEEGKKGGNCFQLELQTPTCKLTTRERQTYYTALSAPSRPGRCQIQVL